MVEELLPIGRFARLCRLSIKQLRHYDEMGLLAPAHVDAATGYRYYARGQVRDAMAIALLRTLDVPLAAIAETLAGDEVSRAEVLAAERDRLQEQLVQQQRTLAVLERLLDDGLMTQEVSLSREPARRLLVVQTVCEMADIGSATRQCIATLMAVTAGASWAPPVWGLFPVDLEAPMRVAAGVQSDASITGTVVEHLPAGPAAVTTHVGPYEHLVLAYQALFAWIHERGLRPHGTVAEAYLTDPTTSDPAQLVTRIVIPIEEEEQS